MLSKLELKRKAWHVLAGLGYIFLVYFEIVDVLETMGLLLVFILIAIVYVRRMNKLMRWVVESVERKKNLKRSPVGGVVYFLLAALIAMVIFPRDIFLAVMIISILGDAAAPLIGQFGYIQYFYNKKKKLEGVIAGVIAGGLGAMLFVPWWEAFLAAFFVMFLEGLDLRIFKWKIDDNFMIPIVAGAVILVLRIII